MPEEDAAAIRDRAAFTVEAVKEREKVTDHDVAAFVDVVADSVGRGRALGAPRAHVLGRARHRAGAAALAGRADPRGRRRALPRRARPRARASTWTRSAWAAPTASTPSPPPSASSSPASPSRRTATCAGSSARSRASRSGALSGAVGTYAANGPEFEEAVLRRLGLGARGRLDAGGAARPPRRAADGDRAGGRRARALRHRDPPPPAHRGARGRGAVPGGRPEGLVGDAAQAQPDRVASASPASPGCCAATRRPASRTWRSGTSATSRTRRSSGWRCPTRRSCSTTRSTWRSGWSRA